MSGQLNSGGARNAFALPVRAATIQAPYMVAIRRLTSVSLVSAFNFLSSSFSVTLVTPFLPCIKLILFSFIFEEFRQFFLLHPFEHKLRNTFKGCPVLVC